MPAEDSPTSSGTQARDDATAPLAPLRFHQKLLYGLGEGGEGVKNTALQIFLFFYYIQVVGLSGSLCGLALFLALLVDGFSDPLVGVISDRFRSRWGRRHLFLYAAPIPLAIAILLLFSPPAGWPQWALFAWLLVFAIAARLSMTFYYVPHMALGAELSEDYRERLAVGGYRMLFSHIGRLVCLVAAFSVFFVATPTYSNGQLNPDAYQPFAFFCGLAVIAFVMVSAVGTQKRALAIYHRLDANRAHTANLMAVWVGFFNALKLKSFFGLFMGLLVMYIFGGTQTALALHINTYYWGLTPQQTQFVFYAQLAGFIVGIPLARPLAARLDKKMAYMCCVGGSCVVVSIPVFLRLLGLFPENGHPLVLPVWALANLGYGIIGASSGILSAAMLADIADEYDLKYGDRAEGLFFGAVAFSSKASIGLGGALAGVLLDVINFPRTPKLIVVPDDTLWRLGLVYGPVLLLILFLGLSFVRRYDLTRERHAAVLEAINQRRAVAAA